MPPNACIVSRTIRLAETTSVTFVFNARVCTPYPCALIDEMVAFIPSVEISASAMALHPAWA